MKGALKTLERGFRNLLLEVLRIVARRRRSVPHDASAAGAKILFIRQDRIGDVLVSTPVFSALKDRFPDCTLDIVLSPGNHFVLANSPHIRKRWIYTKSPLESLRLLRNIRAERYDFVIDLMDNPSATSTVILLLAGGKWNVGLAKENSYACDIVVPLKSRRDSHIVERIAELMRPLGIDPSKEHLAVRYFIDKESNDEVSRFLEATGKDRSTLVGINISAGSDTRFWGIRNYRGLIERIAAGYPDMTVVLLGKPQDRSRLADIAAGIGNALVPPETSFDVFAAWISRFALLVTPDTSAVHLAAAFGIPAVVLYVQSNPDLRIWEPYGSPHEAVITTVDDLSTIPIEEVLAAFERLWMRTRKNVLTRDTARDRR
ncbi:MAG: heptosyltransferase [Bacteroidia bacterium]|nr:MAG: heptosyltransferase [Bacteroidia bacterium]